MPRLIRLFRSAMFVFGLAGLCLFVGLTTASAQSPSSASSAATGAGKQFAKRIVLPIAVVMAAVDSASAYEQHCQLVPDEEAFACTAEAFTREQVQELRELGYDLSETWTYVIVPYAEHFWDENGDDIKAGARAAADTAADAAIATGDAIVEYAPQVWNWLSDQMQ